jgi:hypothetical protein
MYNYIFGTKKDILKQPKNFLIFVKRLLPKYANSLPDSGAITLFNMIKKLGNKRSSIIETGVGASTIALFLASYIYKKKLYSFDHNPDKISLLKTVIHESICIPLNIKLTDFWTPIPSNSVDKFTGINCLSEFKENFNFGFFDSAHSLDFLSKEIIYFHKIANKNFIIGIDDGEKINNKEFHFDFINMIRSKIGLKKIKNPSSNTCDYFYKEVHEILLSKSNKVMKLRTFFEKNLENDLYFNFFGNDISYEANEDKKNINNFKYKNLFKNMSKKEKDIYKNRISFFKVEK